MIKYATVTASTFRIDAIPGQTVIDSMATSYKLAAISSLLLAAPLGFACEYPKPEVTIPDGDTATHEEMVEAQQQIKDYQKELGVYLDCLDEEELAALQAIEDLQPDDEQRKVEARRIEVLREKRNAAAEEEAEIAEQFNSELHVYQNRSSE